MIRVLIAEDHLMVRAGIRALLEKAGDIHVMGEASNGQEAIEMTEAQLLDVRDRTTEILARTLDRTLATAPVSEPPSA